MNKSIIDDNNDGIGRKYQRNRIIGSIALHSFLVLVCIGGCVAIYYFFLWWGPLAKGDIIQFAISLGAMFISAIFAAIFLTGVLRYSIEIGSNIIKLGKMNK